MKDAGPAARFRADQERLKELDLLLERAEAFGSTGEAEVARPSAPADTEPCRAASPGDLFNLMRSTEEAQASEKNIPATSSHKAVNREGYSEGGITREIRERVNPVSQQNSPDVAPPANSLKRVSKFKAEQQA